MSAWGSGMEASKPSEWGHLSRVLASGMCQAPAAQAEGEPPRALAHLRGLLGPGPMGQAGLTVLLMKTIWALPLLPQCLCSTSQHFSLLPSTLLGRTPGGQAGLWVEVCSVGRTAQLAGSGLAFQRESGQAPRLVGVYFRAPARLTS